MQNKIKSRVFVTGANGFVGANIVRMLLKNNYDVHILQRTKTPSWRLKEIVKQITIHRGDITKYDSVKKAIGKAKPDYIIHLAVYGAYHYQQDMEKIIKVNIIGTQNLLEASKNIPYKCFINTGSSSEYGFKNTPMTEDDFCEPASYYAATKLAATNICKVFAKLYDKPIITFRLFSAYGPYEESRRFIPTIMNALIHQETINVTPRKQRRDFIYIDDICEIYKSALHVEQELHGKVYNVGTGEEYTNDEVVSTLFKITAQETKVNKGAYKKHTWDTEHWVADINRTKKAFGWKPNTTIEEGLKKTYTWFQNNSDLYK